MIRTVLDAAARLLGLRRPQVTEPTPLRFGPRWAWCEEEKTFTPHVPDVDGQRCVSCKTTTPREEKNCG